MRENIEVQHLNYRGSTENGKKIGDIIQEREFTSDKTKKNPSN